MFGVATPRPGRGVKTLPGFKSQKRVSGRVSGGVSEGPGRPPKTSQKRISSRLCESKITCFFDSGDSFLIRFGGSGRTLGDSPRDSPRDSFVTFWAGEGFDSSARSGGGVASLGCILGLRLRGGFLYSVGGTGDRNSSALIMSCGSTVLPSEFLSSFS